MAVDVAVELRATVLVFVRSSVVLVRRSFTGGGWALPGGYPESDELLAACAQRELAEETGLQRTVSRCVLLHEAKVHGVDYRVIDVVFAADGLAGVAPASADGAVHP